ncbi:unnamed protein product [Alopecurus aequalis]
MPSWDTNHVMAWKDVRLPTPVYVRKDRSGAFHTYPDLGGPFQNFDATHSALDTHARGSSSTDTSKETYMERVTREFLFWSDGTRFVSTELEVAENVQRLVKALLDKHNDDKDLEYELKDIVHWQSICEGPHEWYYHLNITVKNKGAAGNANLFFAEATRNQNDMPGYFLSSFWRIDPDSKDEQWRDSDNTKEEDEELRKEAEDRIRESFDFRDDEELLEELLSQRRANLLALNSSIQDDRRLVSAASGMCICYLNLVSLLAKVTCKSAFDCRGPETFLCRFICNR